MDNKQVTAEWIAQQRAVCAASTPGPWSRSDYASVLAFTDYEICQCVSDNDMEFITSARTALPAALDALESSMAREAEKEKQCGIWRKASERLADHEKDLQQTIASLTAERDAEKRRADDAAEEIEALKNIETTNYICAIRHYAKYGSRYTFALPHQWYELTFDNYDEYQEFSMQLVYLLAKAREKYEKGKSISNGPTASNTGAPTGAESENSNG